MRRISPAVALLLVLLLPLASLARTGSLAVVNAGKSGHELAQRAGAQLSPLVGGWARQPSVAALLAGDPHAPAPASGEPGEELARLSERLREQGLSQAELADLGQLLGVDYLLLLQARGQGYAARLFSVRLQRYAPQGLEAEGLSLAALQEYVLTQTRAEPAPAQQSHGRWWLWGLAAALVGVSLGLSLSAGDDSEGDLRIRVVRP